jgi:hypothetical protein
MISIRSQAAASRRNSPEGESSGLDLTSEGENQSPQDLLPQNFPSSTPAIRPRPDFEDTDMSAASSYLAKVGEIDPLNEPSDWPEWSRKLKLNLSVAKLWKTLTGETPESSVSDTEQHTIWSERKDQLEGLISLILGTAPRSLIEASSAKNATEQYKILKAEYNKISISSYALLYRRIFRCSLANHKSLQEYADEIINARNKLTDLGRPLDELAVTCAFLNELDSSYQG